VPDVVISADSLRDEDPLPARRRPKRSRAALVATSEQEADGEPKLSTWQEVAGGPRASAERLSAVAPRSIVRPPPALRAPPPLTLDTSNPYRP
jgi:hypothetical protein